MEKPLKTLKKSGKINRNGMGKQQQSKLQQIKNNMETEETNVGLLYRYAAIVLDQKNKGNPTGEITKITIEDTYGTTITIKINRNGNN